MSKTAKNAYISLLGALLGGGGEEPNFFLSSFPEMNFYEHFKYLKARKNICQDVLASSGAKTWIIRASDVDIGFWEHIFLREGGGQLPPKRAFLKLCEYFWLAQYLT